MPVTKSAFLRYRIIDRCLTNSLRRFPTKEIIIENIEEQTGLSLSKSMFSKDIRAMKDHFNAPIEFEKNKKGYYYSQNGFTIKTFPLTNEEIEALDFSTALFQQLKDTKMFVQFENAINRLIEGYRVSKIIHKSEKQILQVETPLKTDSNQQWLEIILKAIVEKNTLKITYQPFGKEQKVHEFSGYLLKEFHNRWYAIGHSNRYDDVLSLALDRIISIEPTKLKYKSDDQFNPEDFFKYSYGITQFNDQKPEKVLLHFSAAETPYILTQPLHHSQKIIKQDENGLTVELLVYISYDFIQLILGHGNRVKVLKPEKLKKKILENLKENLAQYSNK